MLKSCRTEERTEEGEPSWWWRKKKKKRRQKKGTCAADAISALSASGSPGTPPQAASASRTLGGNYPVTAATLMGVYEERAPPTTGMHWVSVIPLFLGRSLLIGRVRITEPSSGALCRAGPPSLPFRSFHLSSSILAT